MLATALLYVVFVIAADELFGKHTPVLARHSSACSVARVLFRPPVGLAPCPRIERTLAVYTIQSLLMNGCRLTIVTIIVKCFADTFFVPSRARPPRRHHANRYNRSGQRHAVSAGVRIELRTPLRQGTGPGVRHGRPDVPEQMHDASGNM